MKLFLAALLIVLVACPVLAANRCKVNDPKMTGTGAFATAGGDRCEGTFVDGKPTGKGVYLSAKGDRYEGISGKAVWMGGEKPCMDVPRSDLDYQAHLRTCEIACFA